MYKDKPNQNKVIKHYANPALGEKCYFAVVKVYFNKLPPQLFEDTVSVFYWKLKILLLMVCPSLRPNQLDVMYWDP